MLETPDVKQFDPISAIELWNAAPRVSRRIKQAKETVQPIDIESFEASNSAPLIDKSVSVVTAEVEEETELVPEGTESVTSVEKPANNVTPELQDIESSQGESLSASRSSSSTIETVLTYGSVKPLAIDKSIQISVDLVDKGVQTGSSAKGVFDGDDDMKQYESDEDYDYKNSPVGLFELDSKVEYFDRMERASVAFNEFLEMECR